MQLLIHFVDSGDSGRQVEVSNFLRRDILQVHHQGPQAISMRNNQNISGIPQKQLNFSFVKAHNAIISVVQALTLWRSYFETPSPNVHLLCSVFLLGFSLIESLQITVKSFVQRA